MLQTFTLVEFSGAVQWRARTVRTKSQTLQRPKVTSNPKSPKMWPGKD